MAKLTAPLFSLDASGTIAKAITFSRWKGIKYARTRVIPANPKSDAQVDIRNVFSSLSQLWKRMPALGREPYLAAVEGLPLTDRNKHIQQNAKTLRDDAGFDNYVWSVAGGQALPPSSFATGGGADRINVEELEIPTAPVGYTFLARVAAGIAIGDPTQLVIRTMYAETNALPTGGFPILAVPSGQYWTGGWIKWTRDSDSKIFYSSFLVSGAVVP